MRCRPDDAQAVRRRQPQPPGGGAGPLGNTSREMIMSAAIDAVVARAREVYLAGHH